MAKASQAEKKARTSHILQLLLDGAETPQIREDAKVLEWGIAERQLLRYIELAYRQLMPILARNREQSLARHYATRRALYARCLAKGDLRTAHLVLKDLAELEALYVSKVSLTDPTGQHEIGYESRQDRRKEIEAALRKLLAGPADAEPEAPSGEAGRGTSMPLLPPPRDDGS